MIPIMIFAMGKLGVGQAAPSCKWPELKDVKDVTEKGRRAAEGCLFVFLFVCFFFSVRVARLKRL